MGPEDQVQLGRTRFSDRYADVAMLPVGRKLDMQARRPRHPEASRPHQPTGSAAALTVGHDDAVFQPRRTAPADTAAPLTGDRQLHARPDPDPQTSLGEQRSVRVRTPAWLQGEHLVHSEVHVVGQKRTARGREGDPLLAPQAFTGRLVMPACHAARTGRCRRHDDQRAQEDRRLRVKHIARLGRGCLQPQAAARCASWRRAARRCRWGGATPRPRTPHGRVISLPTPLARFSAWQYTSNTRSKIREGVGL